MTPRNHTTRRERTSEQIYDKIYSCDYPRYRHGWRVTRAGEVYANAAPVGTQHSKRHADDLLIGHVFRHDSNPRKWVASDLGGYWIPQDGRIQTEAGDALYEAYLRGVARPQGWEDWR